MAPRRIDDERRELLDFVGDFGTITHMFPSAEGFLQPLTADEAAQAVADLRKAVADAAARPGAKKVTISPYKPGKTTIGPVKSKSFTATSPLFTTKSFRAPKP